MVNLVDVIEQITSKIISLEQERDREIKKIKEKYDKEIEKYQNAYKVNLELNEACLFCKGKGKYTYTDSAGQIEREVCKKCNGTGKIK